MTATATVLFAGAGLETEALRGLGVEVTEAINHDQITVDTHDLNHPNTHAECADITAIRPARRHLTNILAASPSCFPAGTPVITARGVVPIDTVAVGDRVLTHRGHYQFAGKAKDATRMIGNGVPIPTVQAVLRPALTAAGITPAAGA